MWRVRTAPISLNNLWDKPHVELWLSGPGVFVSEIEWIRPIRVRGSIATGPVAVVEPVLLPLELGLVVHLLVDGGLADCLRIAKFRYKYREMTTSLLNFQYRTPPKATAPSLSPISSTKTSSKVCRPIPLQKAESASFPLMHLAMVVVLIHPRTVCWKKSLSI
jgi:hypothetical protein